MFPKAPHSTYKAGFPRSYRPYSFNSNFSWKKSLAKELSIKIEMEVNSISIFDYDFFHTNAP